MTRLNLSELTKEAVKDVCEEYQINVCEVVLNDGRIVEVWCRDGDLDSLLIDSGINVGSVYNKKKKFDFDEDYEPVGLDYNDYIETTELIQDGISYYFPVYCAYNGVGAEDAIAIFERVSI